MQTARHVWLEWIVRVSVASTLAFGLTSGVLPVVYGEGKPGSGADVKITNFHLVETKDGKRLWEVWGDVGEVFEKAGVARVVRISNPVTVTLYSGQSKLTSRSDEAILNMRTKDVRLEGNVIATSGQGNSLQTESLDWSAKDRRLFTRSPVRLVRDGVVSSGVGLEAETDLERARFLSRVRSHVIPGGVGLATKDRSSSHNEGAQ